MNAFSKWARETIIVFSILFALYYITTKATPIHDEKVFFAVIFFAGYATRMAVAFINTYTIKK